jgi:glutamine synthetase
MLPADLAARLHSSRDVECLFADITGYPRGKLVPATSFAAGDELRIAQAIPMQAVTGEYSYHPVFPDADPDVRLVPDYTSVRPVPWASTPRALAIHDCLELDGSPCEFAPRTVLQQVLARYAERGLSPVVAPEIEFYLTAINPDPAQPLTAPVTRGGRAENGQSAFSLNLLNELAPFWDEFEAALEQLEVRVDTWVHEVGLSQYEINLLHGDPLAVADQAFLFKYAAKEVALRHGLNAVFMAKPLSGQPGSSMHLHQSVVDGEGRNIFSQADGSESPALRHYLGGLQRHLPDLMLVFAPFVNSYRRFVRNSQAPVNCLWGYDNRTAGLRVPNSGPAARRVENRLAGADANPYLAIAASLAAGLAGLDAGLAASEPLADNGYDQGHSLPRSLHAALAAFSASASVPALLGQRFATAYAAVKELEFDSYLGEISPWERRYLLAQV